MAVDMFLEIKDIPGETKDDEYSKTKGMDVLAWSWGMSQSGTFHSGAGGGAGKVNIQDLSFTKWVDIASPLLMLYCSNGTHIPEATLTVRKAGGKTPLKYLLIKMSRCMVTSLSTGGSGGEDKLTENVTLNFAEVAVKYTSQKDDGAEGEKKEYKWNIESNKQL